MAASSGFGKFLADQKNYLRIYEDAYGLAVGKPCCFCGEPVLHKRAESQRDHDAYPYARSLVIHHEDEDRSNNVPKNLKVAHLGCHSAHHQAMRTPEWGWKWARKAALACHAKKNAEGKSVNAVRLGKAMAKIRIRCDECGTVSNPGGLVSHQKASGHTGKTRLN